MNYYRGPALYHSRSFPFLFGAPLIGGFVGGLLGSALFRPRPVYPPPIYPYGGGIPFGYGGPYGLYGPYW